MDMEAQSEVRVQDYTHHPGMSGGTDSCPIDLDGKVRRGDTVVGEKIILIPVYNVPTNNHGGPNPLDSFVGIRTGRRCRTLGSPSKSRGMWDHLGSFYFISSIHSLYLFSFLHLYLPRSRSCALALSLEKICPP